MNDLSEIAPKGHWYTQAPQDTHLSALMVALRVSGSMDSALGLQARMQGRVCLMMAD